MEFLQRQGLVEVSKVKPDELFSSMDTAASCALFEKGTKTAASAVEILNRYCPEKTSLLSFLNGRKVLSVEESEAFAARWSERMSAAERILALEREIAQARSEILKLEAAEEALVPWLDLPVPLSFQGTSRVSGWVGSVQGERSEADLLRAMTEAVPTLGPVHVEVVHASKEMTSFYAVALKRDAQGVEAALAALGFARPQNPSPRMPSEALERLREKRQTARARIDASTAEIKGFEPLREEFRLLEDYLRMRAEKYAALERLGQSRHAMVLMGYVPHEDAAALEKRLTERFDCAVEFSSAADDPDMPIKLKNRPYAAATETVLENYNLPSGNEIDPSPVMSFFYYLMFGLMLSDAGYGFILAVACAVLPLLYPNMEDSWRRTMRMYFWCGVSTVFWGVLFSSYFGDAINVISATFFGREVSIPPLWFAPLDQPMRLLIFCLGIGMVHLGAGYVMKARNLATHRQSISVRLLYRASCGFLVF